jgi:DNA-binding transcriptional ArsR family regulator
MSKTTYGAASRLPLTYNQMVVDEVFEAQTDRVFHALADRTRRDIVVRSMQVPSSVTELSRAYSMSFAAVQKHVAVLEHAGLVTKQRSGRAQLGRANPETVRRAAALLEQYEALWVERADRMRSILTTGQ